MTNSAPKIEKNGKIVWPRFEKMSDYTLETLWKDNLQNCARDHPPRRMKILSNDKLTLFLIDKTKKDIDLPNDDKEAFQIMIKSFKTLGMVSESDKKARENEFKNTYENREKVYQSWQEVKPARDKENLILDYVLRQRSKMRLDSHAKQLHSLINYGLTFKLLTADDMIIKEGKLVDIIDIKYQDDKWILDRELQLKKTPRSNKKVKKSSLEEDMGKLIVSHTKRLMLQS